MLNPLCKASPGGKSHQHARIRLLDLAREFLGLGTLDEALAERAGAANAAALLETASDGTSPIQPANTTVTVASAREALKDLLAVLTRQVSIERIEQLLR